MTNPVTKTKKQVIVPSIKEEGKEHVLETLLNQDEAPILKSIGYAKVPKSNNYVSYIITSKGDQVISIETDEPNLRSICEETAKINFVQEFMSREE